jgi:transcriptional repressor NrdR
MKCPACGHLESKVIDSRVVQGGLTTRRRRECENPACRKRFTTRERVDGAVLQVVKKDGEREDFDRRKILASLEIACKKREVPPERLEALTSDIEQAVLSEAGAEIDSHDIGEEVMRRLHALDEVAYVRYASVYRRFQDAADFAAEAERVRRARRPAVSERQSELPFDPPEKK